MIIHLGVWGPSKVNTLGGSLWFVTFIDDYTRMTWYVWWSSKVKWICCFKSFIKSFVLNNNAQVRVLCSDNRGEYSSCELKRYLEKHGTAHQTTCLNTTQENGVTERKNYYLLEVVHALLIKAHLP